MGLRLLREGDEIALVKGRMVPLVVRAKGERKLLEILMPMA